MSPDARVEPSGFCHDEYPVYCRRCDYPLKGLAEGKCSECGAPFDRGRLLLEQYVLEGGGRRNRKKLRRLTSVLILAAAVIAALALAWHVLEWWRPSAAVNALASVPPYWVGVGAIGLTLMAVMIPVTMFWIMMLLAPSVKEKDEARAQLVFAALEEPMDTAMLDRRGRRFKMISNSIFVALLLALLAYSVSSQWHTWFW